MARVKALRALQVVARTPHIRRYLLANDPQALKQVEAAIASEERLRESLDRIAAECRAKTPAEFRLPEE